MLFIESVDDEDEVLLALSEELGVFVEYVGGPEHASVLLAPLESLANVEEAVVREKVILLLKIYIPTHPPKKKKKNPIMHSPQFGLRFILIFLFCCVFISFCEGC